jgi:hypothetical protein
LNDTLTENHPFSVVKELDGENQLKEKIKNIETCVR